MFVITCLSDVLGPSLAMPLAHDTIDLTNKYCDFFIDRIAKLAFGGEVSFWVKELPKSTSHPEEWSEHDYQMVFDELEGFVKVQGFIITYDSGLSPDVVFRFDNSSDYSLAFLKYGRPHYPK